MVAHGASRTADIMARLGRGALDWGGFFTTQYFADPKENIVGVLMKQGQGGNDETGWKFRQLVSQIVGN